jgi:signal transduction histidine kinase/ligand-binding sensor domain-containing protein/DNA-binding response OmpR family regulator
MIFLIKASCAQQGDFNFINFSSKDGLSSNSVNAILKDKFGYMWFGTDDGLSRFDGVSFRVYRYSANNKNSIAANSISVLCEDQSGNLWIGTNQGLSLYTRKQDAFLNYDLAGKQQVRSLCNDHLGNIWVGTYVGLFRFNPITGEKRKFDLNPGAFSQIMANTVLCIYEDRKRRLWIGTNAGFYLYNTETNKFQTFQHIEADTTSIAGNSIRSIVEDSVGNIWFGTDQGISKFSINEKVFKNFKSGAEGVYTIKPDKENRLWVGTDNGLKIFDLTVLKFISNAGNKKDNYFIKNNSIRSIFIDENKIFWIGTQQGGVNKYDENLAFFNLKQSNPVDPRELNSSRITSFAESLSGDIYVGTSGGGLNLFKKATGVFEHVNLEKKSDRTLSIVSLKRIDNEIWVGSHKQGLYVLNMVSGFVKHYLQGDGFRYLSGNSIYSIKKDSRGNIWIGTNGNGINVYRPQTGTFLNLGKPDSVERDRLSLNGFIRAIEEDSTGNIWIGSHGSGICVYNLRTRKFRIINREKGGLVSDYILSIHTDKDGDVWIGTLGNGLCVFKKKTRKFQYYSESSGLSNGVVYKILEDDSGRIWVSTNKGLSSFDKKTKRFTNYSHHNGLQKSTFAFGAGLKTSSGELYFGGHDGFNYFNPAALHSNSNVPSLVFTDLRIANASVVPSENAAIREHISIAKEIKLDYKQNFSLDFAALNYTSPQENRYAYKLDGFDREWNEVGELHSAVYTNLDPGEYTFKVRAKSENGSWSTPERTIKIHVRPPIWRTPYAYVFYLLFAGATLFFIRRRNIQRFKNKLALEQAKQLIEGERREAERQHHFDQQRIKFLTNLSHEFRTPISLIVGPVEKMLQEEATVEKKEQLGLVQRNARRLLNLVNQLLDFRKLEESELKLNLSEGDIVSVIKEIADSFKDLSENKHIDFHFISSVEEYHTLFDRDKMERILFNLLSNAFKFTAKGGVIKLKIEQKGIDNITIRVSDTGIGMSEEVQKKIFDRFFQGDMPAVILNQGTGIGLSITREFVKLHGGSIELQSEQDKGTAFTIELPLKQITKLNKENFLQIKEEAIVPGSIEEIPESEKLMILIIEDSDDFRSYLKDSLKPYYKIVEATNGKEGWQKALSTHPKVIVSDISMPGMDGITLCRKLKSDKRTAHIPVILLTALTGDSNQLSGLKTGASDYLTKPFNSQILNLKIKNLVSLNQELEKTYKKQIHVNTPGPEVQSEKERLLLKITQYIEANIDNPSLSVEDLSKHVLMSRGTLYNKIVDLTGETPIEFIRSIRLKRAAALLETSDMKIGEIGYAVGFTLPNYFAKIFKTKFSLSPSEYAAIKRKLSDSPKPASSNNLKKE